MEELTKLVKESGQNFDIHREDGKNHLGEDKYQKM